MDDLISRQAAIDAIDSLYFDTFDDHDRTKERIKRLPAAQPERKKGKWEHIGFSKSYRFTCSVCGGTAYYVSGSCASTRNKVRNVCGYSYCPNCGADMRDDFSEHMNPPTEV